MELNEIIKQHRIDQNLTQQQLADMLYITRQSISRWETGKVTPPLNALYDLAKIYNITLEEFLGGKIMRKKKVNLFSLLGSLILNLFLLSTVGIFLLSIWLSAWLLIVVFSFSPLILFVVNVTGEQPFAWDQTIYAFLIFIIGIVLIKPMLWLTKILYRSVSKYFRYNLSNIYYEVI